MFRLVTIAGRAALEHDGGWHDLATLSGDASLADSLVAVARHAELHDFQAQCAGRTPEGNIADVELEAPVPRSRQVFAIGLNYSDHAKEMDLTGTQPTPFTFTKFPSCITVPNAEVPLSGDRVDWEAEFVVVIGDECHGITVEDAWNHVAGITLGQDISDRTVQNISTPAQFSLGKSFPNYGPIGPALVSLDTFDDHNDIGITCDVNDERMQDARSTFMIYSIPKLVAYLASIVTLYPGDIIFTGSPSGVGQSRGRFLVPGDVITTTAEKIGTIRNVCVPGTGYLPV